MACYQKHDNNNYKITSNTFTKFLRQMIAARRLGTTLQSIFKWRAACKQQ